MKKKYNVDGMTCASCQSHVQKAIESIDGVNSCNVNLLKNFAEVEFDETKVNDDLICSSVDRIGYKAYLPSQVKEENKKDHSLLELIIASLFLIILMYFSMGNMMWGWPTFPFLDHKKNPMGFALIQFILLLPIIYIYRRYFINGFKKFIKRAPNMDTLICIGSFSSLIYGIFALFMISWGVQTGNTDIVEEYHMSLYFESSGMILVFVSFGKYLESLSKKKTTKAIEELMDLAPKYACIIVDKEEKKVLVKEVKEGDIIICKKGEAVPVDGVIISGQASFDEANLTGESIPKYKTINDEVYASSIVMSGYVTLKATKVGDDSSINTIIRLVEEASNSKAPISRLADKVSSIFVPTILVIAILVFILNFIYIKAFNVEYVSSAFETSLNFSLTVLVIACPCALGLATPVAIMVGSGKGAQNGLLIKNGEILEKAHSISTVVLDKTGTITEGKPSVSDIKIYVQEEDVYSIIYALESKSEHPLASALTKYALTKKKEDLIVEDFIQEEGKGVKGLINQTKYCLGNISYLQNHDEVKEDYLRLSKEGKTALVLVKDSNPICLVALKDKVKESSLRGIEELKANKIKVIILTGDNEEVAKSIAKEVGVDEVIAEVFPKDKARIIKSLKKDDKHLVAMVGDGVNDALALSSADLGISLGGGSDIAKESSDIVLLRNNLEDVSNVIRLSRRIINTIKLGLFWAFFYNLICVILATGLFYYLTKGNFKIQPMHGAIAMSISSVSVVLNALTINLFKVRREERKENEVMEQNIVIKVEGMMCQHCVKHVQNACLSIEGVTSAIASLEEKNVTVTAQSSVNEEILKKAIVDAGYEVK